MRYHIVLVAAFFVFGFGPAHGSVQNPEWHSASVERQGKLYAKILCSMATTNLEVCISVSTPDPELDDMCYVGMLVRTPGSEASKPSVRFRKDERKYATGALVRSNGELASFPLKLKRRYEEDERQDRQGRLAVYEEGLAFWDISFLGPKQTRRDREALDLLHDSIAARFVLPAIGHDDDIVLDVSLEGIQSLLDPLLACSPVQNEK